jgi:hypothetical protein
MRYRVNRSDNGSKALIAYAKSLGFDYESLGGSIDGALAWGTQAILVDWKSKGGTLTPTQQRLVARGFPIRFLSTTAQIDALRAELMRVA